MEGKSHKHPWYARLFITLIMAVLAFIGMVVTDIHKEGSWTYWKWIIPVYALLALWLNWYIRSKKETLSPITIWHEILHWLGLIAAVFLIAFFVHEGLVSRFIAGLFNLTLLALTLFTLGVYIEPTFIFIGLLLGAFAFIASFVVEYFYALTLPIFIIALLGIFVLLFIYKRKHRAQ
jgi:hypothetical protein